MNAPHSIWENLGAEARRLNPHLAPPDPAKLVAQFDAARDQVAEAKSERHLHGQIKGLLRRNGLEWFFHGSTAHRTKRTLGEPDFTIPIPGGRTLYWEIKFGSGDLRPEQRACIEWLEANGHAPRVIRSYDEAVAALTDALAPTNKETI